MKHTKEQVMDIVSQVFQEVFDDDSLEIVDETDANDIEEWDSVMHISLVVSIEKAFNVRLNAAEVGKLDNVGMMIDLLLNKLNSN